MNNRPNREDIIRGRTIARMREDGQELVDEERLAQLFTDLRRDLEGDSTPEALAQKAMGILRG